MVTLRCTRKLVDFLGQEPINSPPTPTNVLGDWYANLIPTMFGDFILFTRERSLLTVAVLALMVDDLLPHFKLRVANQLAGIGIPPGTIIQELAEMDPIQFAKSASRSILGSMNDLAFHFQYYAEVGAEERDYGLSKVEWNLNHMPHGPIDYAFAADAARQLFTDRKSSRN